MTRDQFISDYCTASGITPEWFSEYMEAIPCECGDEICNGWQMVAKDRGLKETQGWIGARALGRHSRRREL